MIATHTRRGRGHLGVRVRQRHHDPSGRRAERSFLQENVTNWTRPAHTSPPKPREMPIRRFLHRVLTTTTSRRKMTTPIHDMPSADFRFQTSVHAVETTAAEVAGSLHSACTKIASIAPADRTVANTLLAFHAAQNAAAARQQFATFPAMVHADGPVRTAAARAKTTLKLAFDGSYAHRGVWDALVAVRDQVPADLGYLYSRTLDLHRANGIAIDSDADRAQFAALKTTAAKLEEQYTQAINEDTTTIEVPVAELEGLPATFIEGLEKKHSGDIAVLSTKTPDYVAVMQGAKSRSLRRQMHCAYNGRCEANQVTLARLLRARDHAARLAGFASHAHMRLAGTMVSDPAQLQWMRDLAVKLQPKRDADMAALRTALSREQGQDEAANQLGPLAVWDLAFAQAALKRQEYDVDENAIAAYFPLEHAVRELLGVYSELLAIEFAEANDMPKWHENVRAYVVYARKEDGSRGDLVGHFYMDLHPRPGKYSHQCVAPLMPSTIDGSPTGSRTYPIAANIGNLTRPTATTPSLLKFSEVRTVCHELGHVAHKLKAETPHALLSWTWSVNPYPGGVDIFFLELPSQMFENWMYDERVLARVAKHHETGAGLPSDVVAKLRKLRKLQLGNAYSRQLYMSLFDLAIHSPGFIGPNDDDEAIVRKMRNTWADLQRTIHGTELAEGTWPWAAWYHLAQGYDAVYSSYLVSEVYAHDCFAEFVRRAEGKGGCMSVEVAQQYVKEILTPGATKGGMDMVVGFLGRQPDMEPFLKHVLED
ncbi:hypothetical protein BC828DRAFT_381744 [Blastocladiella britannica]|nr:hypothetical protein BC828DRAFT_381744 [Blastocladiella britannica]